VLTTFHQLTFITFCSLILTWILRTRRKPTLCILVRYLMRLSDFPMPNPIDICGIIAEIKYTYATLALLALWQYSLCFGFSVDMHYLCNPSRYCARIPKISANISRHEGAIMESVMGRRISVLHVHSWYVSDSSKTSPASEFPFSHDNGKSAGHIGGRYPNVHFDIPCSDYPFLHAALTPCSTSCGTFK
jgi:hypothetical protein